MKTTNEAVLLDPVETKGYVFAYCDASELIGRTLAGWEVVCAWPHGTTLLRMDSARYAEEPPA